MMAARDVVASDARELRAAGLAALAEAGVIALPAHLILTESGGARTGTLAFSIPFAAVFVAGVLLACVFRARARTPRVAGLVAIAAGLWFGRGDLNREVFGVVVALLVALRAVSLGLRDWREPIGSSFGWGALALGAEVLLATGPQGDWKPLLAVVSPVFFVASLASRATTVWTTAGAGDLDEGVRAAWIHRAIVAAGSVAASMAAAVLFGIRGGVLERVGEWLTPVANAVATVVAFVFSQAARPVFWLVDLLNIDPDAVRRFFENLGRRLREVGRATETPGPSSLWQRLFGLLLFGFVAYVLVRAIRRLRAPERVASESRSQAPGTLSVAALPEELAPVSRGPLRRHLPSNEVRRLYAEALLELERRGLAKDPALTPAEYLPEVASACPECAEGFRALTRGYEDVRYGNVRPDRGAVQQLQLAYRAVVTALRRRSAS